MAAGEALAFVDASYYVALVDPSDPWHSTAKALLRRVTRDGPTHTHVLALGEVVAVVAPRKGGKLAREVYHGIRDDAIVHVPTLDDLDRAMIRVVRHDGHLSLSDALALDIMAREGIKRIASFDADFDGKGVERLGAR